MRSLSTEEIQHISGGSDFQGVLAFCLLGMFVTSVFLSGPNSYSSGGYTYEYIVPAYDEFGFYVGDVIEYRTYY